ncbi:hypothetical protein RRG08_026727 [Elysia crispata]|uniref:Uncharacterized protein n=1 Tax=Elysia crispata TaxID=231223 RepID=A0AAE1E2R1_9GAST|nr:hypothetical protein RRG08_026727 [Elysia crispata]
MLKCSAQSLRNLRNGYEQLSPRCLVLDPATLKSVHQGQRGGDTSSSCSRSSADVMTTQTLENFPKNPAAVGIHHRSNWKQQRSPSYPNQAVSTFKKVT